MSHQISVNGWLEPTDVRRLDVERCLADLNSKEVDVPYKPMWILTEESYYRTPKIVFFEYPKVAYMESFLCLLTSLIEHLEKLSDQNRSVECWGLLELRNDDGRYLVVRIEPEDDCVAFAADGATWKFPRTKLVEECVAFHQAR